MDQIQELKVASVYVTSLNPRRKRCDEKAVAELARSMEAVGLLQPIVVRQHPDKKNLWELIAGTRRLEAASMLGWKIIPAIVKTMEDKAAARAALVENLQRESLSLEDEAESIKALLAQGATLREIAEEIGKSASWVARRASLVDLLPEWQNIFNEHHSTISVREIIARYPPSDQEIFLAQYNGEENCWLHTILDRPDAAEILKEKLEREEMLVSSAPWDVTDKTLKENEQACSDCRHRSMYEPELFFDDGAAASDMVKDDRCLDRACWNGKLATYLARKEAELKKKHANLVKVTSDHRVREPGVLTPYSYAAAKKSDPGAVPALAIDGKNLGKVTWVKPTEPDRPAADRASEPKPDRREVLEAKRWCETVGRFREVLLHADIEKLERTPLAIYLAAVYGTLPQDGTFENFQAMAENPDQDAAMADASSCIWSAVREVLAGQLAYQGSASRFPVDELRDHARTLARLISFNLDTLYDEVCSSKGFSTPKSWLKED